MKIFEVIYFASRFNKYFVCEILCRNETEAINRIKNDLCLLGVYVNQVRDLGEIRKCI